MKYLSPPQAFLRGNGYFRVSAHEEAGNDREAQAGGDGKVENRKGKAC